MNVLYIGPYKQRDGWGNAAKAYVKSLAASGVGLTIRPVFMNMDKKVDDCEEFRQYEKPQEKYDVVIQNVLPHMFRRYEGVVNIGLSYFESANLQYTSWPVNINIMDRMWVTSNFECLNLKDSGVTIPIDVVPIGCDTSVYQKSYDFDKLDHHEKEFKFYFIGEYITRKNVETLMIAFHREFSPDESARLVLKLNKIGMSNHDLFSLITQNIQTLKTKMNMYSNINQYKPEIIICSRFSIEELYGLHQACDCFVVPSYGEAFCMPAFDAMAFGKAPIVGEHSSLTDFITSHTGGHVKNHEIPAIAPDRALPFLYNSRDTWWQINILDLQKKMRQAFVDKDVVSKSQDQMVKKMTESYSYESVGKKIREVLSK